MTISRDELIQALHEAVCLSTNGTEGCGAVDAIWPLVDQQNRRMAAAGAEALRAWIAEWPTTPGDGTFLVDVARNGLAIADSLVESNATYDNHAPEMGTAAHSAPNPDINTQRLRAAQHLAAKFGRERDEARRALAEVWRAGDPCASCGSRDIAINPTNGAFCRFCGRRDADES